MGRAPNLENLRTLGSNTQDVSEALAHTRSTDEGQLRREQSEIGKAAQRRRHPG